MASQRGALGALGERLARQYLEARGYRIVEVNHRSRAGEIDLIALEGGELVFVEVRTRRGEAHGTPAESVVGAKAERLAALAEAYAAEHPELPSDLRVDVVSVEFSPAGKLQRIGLIRNAVGD